jgi:SAM-dependent methyltransferase
MTLRKRWPPDDDDHALAVRASYDGIAAQYSARVCDELANKPLDRGLLDEVATRARGLVCDVGCGPGHVAAYLHDRGARVCGVDLSPGMIGEAKRLNPGHRFEVGDARALACEDGSLGGVVAMYSLIHFEEHELPMVFGEISRVLALGGLVLAAFHRGSEVRHSDEWWDVEVDLDFHFFEREQIDAALVAAGLDVERIVERDPYPGVEVETERLYALATKPLQAGNGGLTRNERFGVGIEIRLAEGGRASCIRGQASSCGSTSWSQAM